MKKTYRGKEVLSYLRKGTYWLVVHTDEKEHQDLIHVKEKTKETEDGPETLIFKTIICLSGIEDDGYPVEVLDDANQKWTRINKDQFECMKRLHPEGEVREP